MNRTSCKGEYILRTAKIQIFQSRWKMFSEEVPDNRFPAQTGEISLPDLLALLQINPAPDFRTQRSKIPPDLRRMSQNPQKRDSVRRPDRTVNPADLKFRHRRGKFGTQSVSARFHRDSRRSPHPDRCCISLRVLQKRPAKRKAFPRSSGFSPQVPGPKAAA